MAFDLDDEELEATRKMHKGSDINVGSIEEDIKILKSIIKVHNDFFPESNKETINEKEIKALNNLINDYKRQKQINEEHQKINGELREKVKELEEDLYSANEIIKEYIDSVPKQKIKDKIKELKKQGDYRTIYNSTGRVHFLNESIDYQINVLQELLEDK